MARPCMRSMSAAMALHLDSVRLASRMSLNTSGSCAHLWATTPPTPPAPMMITFDMVSLLLGSAVCQPVGHTHRCQDKGYSTLKIGVAAQAFAEGTQHLLAFGHRDAAGAHCLFGGLAEATVKVFGLVFDITKHIGDGVAMHFVDEIEAAIAIDAY